MERDEEPFTSERLLDSFLGVVLRCALLGLADALLTIYLISNAHTEANGIVVSLIAYIGRPGTVALKVAAASALGVVAYRAGRSILRIGPLRLQAVPVTLTALAVPVVWNLIVLSAF